MVKVKTLNEEEYIEVVKYLERNSISSEYKPEIRVTGYEIKGGGKITLNGKREMIIVDEIQNDSVNEGLAKILKEDFENKSKQIGENKK